MRLPRCAIAISFSMFFVMSYRQPASSSRSRAARASTTSILLDIFRTSFSNLPILIPMHGSHRRMGQGRRRGNVHAPIALTCRNQFGQSHRPTGSSASTWSTFRLGGDARTDARGRRDTPSRSAALSLRSLPTPRDRYRSEQPSFRPEFSRPQSELGSARSRSGRRNGAIRFEARLSPRCRRNNLSVVFRRV